MSEAFALSVEAVSVERGGRAIVREVSLQVRPGTVVALLGPSGAGKSTLLGAVAGEWPLLGGRVILGGRDVGGLPSWARSRLGLGYLPQGPSVLFDLSVRDNLRSFRKLARSDLDELGLARAYGLEPRLEVKAAHLSGGERRRLELVRALLGRPKVLLCDEPFAGVDPAGVSALAEQLRQQANEGRALVVSDHHAAEALRIADEAHLLADGRVVVSEAPARFLEHPDVTQRYVTR
ncbi:MAG TPA: ATP-binding cassette domain-containing protein [Polyangiaceae bacterium]|nr:ATP-binding cassette domain-containing protein [Polyangiaceae bacterium]